MKKLLLTAAAVGALAFASGAFAQDSEMWYLTNQDGKQMIMGGENAEGSELLVGSGAKPADCPAGHFYTTDASQQMVMKCDDDSRFTLAAPESGTMMENGQPYPEGSMILTPES
jgi:hypothetical protein